MFAPNSKLRRAAYSAAILFIAFIFLWRLEYYPTPWFDEGATLNVALTYARHNIYAEYSQSGYNFIGPVISTGPTIVLPISFLFRFVEPSILASRLVIVAYGFLTMLALWGVGRLLNGKRVAAAALVLVLFAWGNQMPFIFRNVGGEGPAVGLLLAALWFWLRPQAGVGSAVIAGILFGLSSITKTQFGLFILPSLLVAWGLGIFWYKQRRWWHYVIPGVIAGLIFAGWHYYAYFLLGAGLRDIAVDLASVGTAGGGNYLVLDITNKVQNIFDLTNGLTYGGLFIPALIYAVILGLRRDQRGQSWGMLALFVVMSSIIYVLSIGWVRVSIPAKMMMSLLVAQLIFELTNGFRPDWQALRQMVSRLWDKAAAAAEVPLAALTQIVVTGLFCIMIAVPSLRVLYYVVRSGSDDPYRVAEYLDANIADDALIETWEKELSFLSDHQFRFPPQVTEAQLHAGINRQGAPVQEVYDFRTYGEPAFVVIGPIARRASIYTPERLADYVLVEIIGAYEIYQLVP
jgi:hypothetical protein